MNRLSKWIITKLGGYTEQYLPPEPERPERVPYLVINKRESVQLTAAVEIPYLGKDEFSEAYEYSKGYIAEEICEKLLEEGYIEFEEERNLYRSSVILHGRIFVADRR